MLTFDLDLIPTLSGRYPDCYTAKFLKVFSSIQNVFTVFYTLLLIYYFSAKAKGVSNMRIEPCQCEGNNFHLHDLC